MITDKSFSSLVRTILRAFPTSVGALIFLLALISLPIFVVSAASAASANDNRLVSPETQARLREVERRRKELRERLSAARKKEQLALLQLNKIKSRLNETTGHLMSSKHKLKKTETKINETEQKINQTQYKEQSLSEQAADRLREIYEGQRVTFVEMLFQVQSLQSLLDIFYYQERIAAMDKELLDELKTHAEELAAKKDWLGHEKKNLGDLVVQFAQQAMKINKEKLNQEQVADRLKTQRAFYEQAEQQLAMESQRLETQILNMESRNKSKGGSATGSGNLSIPLRAPVTSPFGWRHHPVFGIRRFHTGVDLAGPNHSPIKAADSGSVLYTGWYGGYGKVVIISHGKGMATLYAHLSVIKAQAGENVTKGQVIAYEGTTGFSTGPHLHFEVRLNGKPNNPLNYVR
jgi:murein DD-endopeptidase MepM/ murein hydrolase activator NlpD